MTTEFKLCCPCLFGLEGPLADELRRLGAGDVRAENGRVRFSGDASIVARANISLRCAERVLIELGSAPAPSFDALFEAAAALPWEALVPKQGAFPVKGHSLGSALHSIPDCQRIIKKAVAKRLGEKYGISQLPESGAVYQIQFSIMKDVAYLYLDTSGAGLYKRGYRPGKSAAPLRETLAAAMVSLARYRGREDFCDPFCGSGTIAIEAALAAKNRAPGLLRSFAAESWQVFGKKVWDAEREFAHSRQYNGDYRIFASDIDPDALAQAADNARRAGVYDIISFQSADAARFSRNSSDGLIVTNPPYGERLLDARRSGELYASFGQALRGLSGWRLFLLSSHPDFENLFGSRADKKRKLYNGMIKCELFIYGKRP